jgi:hypothetical protein
MVYYSCLCVLSEGTNLELRSSPLLISFVSSEFVTPAPHQLPETSAVAEGQEQGQVNQNQEEMAANDEWGGDVEWGDDEEFLFVTQMMELDQPPPPPSSVELASLKEINDFAQWNAANDEGSQQLRQEGANEQLTLLKNQLKELETHNENLKMDNYTLQGEASNLRRRLEVQTAEKQQEVFQR